MVKKVVKLETEAPSGAEDVTAALALEEFVASESNHALSETEKKLGPKRLKFVKAFVDNGGRVEDAAATSGYQPEYGVELLRQPNVQKAVKERLERRGVVTSIDREWVLIKMARIADLCSKEVPEMDRRGNVIGTKIADASNAMKALEKIGIEMGMFKDRMDIGGGDKPIETVEIKRVELNIIDLASKIAINAKSKRLAAAAEQQDGATLQ